MLVRKIHTYAALALGIFVTTMATAVSAETSSTIMYTQDEIERVCYQWTNNHEAFNFCVESHQQIGVEVFLSPNGDRGSSYYRNPEFCSLNDETYAPDSPVAGRNGYINPCNV